MASDIFSLQILRLDWAGTWEEYLSIVKHIEKVLCKLVPLLNPYWGERACPPAGKGRPLAPATNGTVASSSGELLKENFRAKAT